MSTGWVNSCVAYLRSNTIVPNDLRAGGACFISETGLGTKLVLANA